MENLDVVRVKSFMRKEVYGSVVDALKVLLADTDSVYHEAHMFHWNVKGQDFSQYHALFEAIYTDLQESIDPIAENILKMGSDAPFTLLDVISLRRVSDARPASTPQEMGVSLLGLLIDLLVCLNNAFKVASDANQQGVANFVAERIDATQKWIWQLKVSTGIQK
jgi:starvation-inducible DNA-binding protein